jgi:hypothetical protein
MSEPSYLPSLHASHESCWYHPVALSLVAFGLTYIWLRQRSLKMRLAAACVFVVLAAPSFLFTFYYAHLLPERVWFYTLRSWQWSDFLVLFLGCAGGALATLLRQSLFNLPWLATVAFGVVPHLKPLIGPLPDSDFQERWKGDACLQSTPSTCGPASVTTILRHLGVESSERATARAAFSYSGGTEAWYLARYVRSRGLVPRFDFQRTFTPAVGFPALVGVRLIGFGHFIAVLDIRDDQVTFADPLYGAERLPLAQFLSRYQFTGFHMVVSKGGMSER